ncbi:hypothetical protein BDZ85DRAFT_204703 [Elsinoe ampelina]|uniref:Integral membrane protein n=1 Tax=Elsinoe ampelina TaxID=302913 RepID=A0A6A6G2R7_9PEZI|nr:hypothetical protein BDZ85DRAFT_204703 [Elsinoe ampelina]
MDHPAHEAHGGCTHTTAAAPQDLPPTYFNHPDYAGWMYAHIILMTIAWAVILPVAVFISTAKSRIAIPVQFLFLGVNALGIFTSIVYDAKTPDLYPNNAHHKIGWAVTWIALAWLLLGLLNFVNLRQPKASRVQHNLTISSQAMARYEQLTDHNIQNSPRFSRDSGHGTERNSSSSFGGPTRTNSAEEVLQKPELPLYPSDSDREEDELEAEHESSPFMPTGRVNRFVTNRIPKFRSARFVKAIKVTYVLLERFQVILAFVALATGFVTWIGIFKTDGLLNGLAHWVKGGIFFWYGLLTLGRWMGAFADFGWAWNAKPGHPLVSRAAARMPSAEFTESFVIFLYGASNVFLEHLTAWGKEWSMMDLEHISITIMFFGGGLLGMLVESKRARELLNTNIQLKSEEVERFAGPSHLQEEEWDTPKTYKISLNPLPALVIFLLGLMMSNHHQDSATSTAIHGQWGTLFSGYALARMFTYLLLYLKPPTSYFPSRPPTELISAFCLICGGLIFMASTRDVIKLLDRNNLHAMFILTVMVGVSCLIMVWTVILYGIRGWAVRREARRMR